MPLEARASYVVEPALSDEFTVAALDPEVRRDLRGLQKETADSVARHLVAAGSLVDSDPERALEHARYARRRASRIAVVREAAGIAAYHAGEWAEALAELRAARRMGGGPVHLPVMADIERALGRPERAVDIARGPEAAELETAGRIELAIVGAGARRDLGEVDAAVVGLQIPELSPTRRDPWSARLFYAYADNLLAAGRQSDALLWFVHATDADVSEETDAAERVAELTGEPRPDGSDDFEFGEDELAELVGTVPVDDPTAGPGPTAAGTPDEAEAAADPVDTDDEGAVAVDEATDVHGDTADPVTRADAVTDADAVTTVVDAPDDATGDQVMGGTAGAEDTAAAADDTAADEIDTTGRDAPGVDRSPDEGVSR